MLLIYLLIRILTFPLIFLPYSAIHALGIPLGTMAYYLLPKFRKRALSNLALAKDLNLSSLQIRQIAKASIQSLMITCLEYPKLASEKKISNIVTCLNPEKANQIMSEGKGVIFFCGHQANWELLFLEGTSRMPGVAIGRPIKNRYLYAWVLKMRQKFGGKIITPKNGIKEGLKGLKKGSFLGIVGDQGMPDSGYSSLFLGRLAWTSPIPAILSYKTNTPLIVATTLRKDKKYSIHYSDPLYPNLDNPLDQEVKRLMDAALDLFAKSIQTCPEQWLWIHNRWKQQTLAKLKSPYRQDSIAIFLSPNPDSLERLSIFRKLYPTEHLAIFTPAHLTSNLSLDAEIIPYTHISELLKEDFRFKLIYTFIQDRSIEKHYKKYATFRVIYLSNLDTLETLVSHA